MRMRAGRRLLAALSALVLVAEVVGSAAPALASGPVLSAVVPPSLAAGAPVRFTGSGFGQSAGTVRFAPSSGTVTSVQATYWSPTQVQATVPDGMAPGVVASSVATAAGLTSNALPLTVTSATYAVVTSGLLLYYSPADANGSGQPGSGLSPATLSDLTPSRDDGTLQGFAGSDAGYTGAGTSASPYALTFDGTDDYVASADLLLPPQVFSLDVWFRTTHPGGVLAGFATSPTVGSGSSDFMLYMDAAGHLVFGVNFGAAAVTSQAAYANGAWHEAIVTLGPGGVTLYVDGSVAGTSQNASVPVNDGYWLIGWSGLGGWPDAPSDEFFRGQVAGVRVYDRTVSPAEVAANFAGGPALLGAAAGSRPQVSALSPTAGAPAGGTSVEVFGRGFTDATGVRFGTAPAESFHVDSDVALTAVAPPGTGTADVTITGPGGTSAMGAADVFRWSSWDVLSGSWTGTDALAFESLVEYTGSAASMVAASIYQPPNSNANQNDCGSAGLLLSPVSEPSVLYAAQHQCDGRFVLYRALLPTGSQGAIDWQPIAYDNYKVGDVPGELDRYQASLSGGTLTVSVANPAGTTSTLTASIPPGAYLVGARVDAGGGIASFAVDGQPVSVPIAAGTLSAISPTDGSQAGGTVVTLTGLGLAETTGVDFGTAPAASFQVVSDTVVTAVAPSGEGTVGVTALSAAGTASVGPQSVFTYLPASVTVTPSSGPESGGTTVAIQGSGLAGATAVDFGTVSAASFKVDSDSEITAVAPPGLGTVDVTVRGPTGWSLLGSADRYAYTLATPVVAGRVPAVGSAAGGQTVTVTGSGFAPNAQVRFGSAPADVLSVAPDGTSLQAVVPPGTGTAQVTVTNPLPVTGLRARGSTAYALFADGSVEAWGDGNRGWGYHDVPVQVRATGATAVAQGWHFGVALRTDGTVAAWGDNCWGELGQGEPANCQLSASAANNLGSSTVPLPVKGLSGVMAVAAGPQFALALRSDGTVWAWGRNDGGQLGDGETDSTGVGTPTEVQGLDGVVAIAAGAASWSTAYALRSDGTVWAWGQGGGGQLGDGKDANSATPVQVTGLHGVVGIAAGASVGYALLADGTVRAWGDGSSGGLGDGSTADSAVPVQVHGLHDVIAIAAGGMQWYGDHAAGYALEADGSVWAWGSTAAVDSTPLPVQVARLPGAVALAANENGDVFVLKGDGSVWAWGPSNGGGELGNGSTTPSTVPVEVSDLRGIIGISAQNDMTLAVRADGTVWAWGGSTWEVLPNGGGPTPVRVAGLAGVVDLSPGTLAVALKSDGTVWGWTDQSSTYNVFPAYPGQKVLPFPVIAVSAGGGRQVFVASEDGSVWAVAGPDIYQASAKPIRVPFPSTVAIRQLVPTGTWLLGLDSTGHVWEWPWQPSAPAQEVPGLQDVVALAGNNDTAYALRADGTVWSWSQGNGPDLGRGTLQGPVVACDAAGAYCTTLNAGQNAVPGPVLGLTDVRAIAADGNTAYALLADGTVWAWGDNSGGALGDGATPNDQTQQDIQSDTPVQVSGLTDAVAIAAGQSNGEIGYALTSDGQVWHWGGSNPFYAFSYSCYCAAPQAPGNLAGSDVPVPVTGFTRGGLLSAFSAASQFTYESETTVPAVASVAPDTGPAGGGTQVTLTGTRLAVAQAVYFGPTAAPSFTVLSDTELTAVAPPGSGSADVRVIAAAGASAVTAHDRFAYAAASAVPSVTGVTPASGPAAGGTTVTISGSGFTGATAVDFGTTASTFTVQSDGTIAATAPPGSGTVDVTVQGPGGTSTTQPADQFTYVPFGAPAQLAFVSQPAWVASLVSFAADSPTSVSVAVYDLAGKLVGDAGGTVTLTLRGPGILGSPWSASAQAVDGVAAFTGLQFPLTQALPGDGYTLVASYSGQGGVADATSAPFSILFPWPLVTSDPAQVSPDGTTLAVWDDVLPAPGQGDDGSIALPWRFAGVQFTAALDPASHLWLAGNAGGTSPICLDGNWTLQLSGPASQTVSGSGCTPPIDLDALGLPAGTYGGQLTLQAPASGTQYGASDVFLLAVSAAAMAPEPLPRAMQPLKLVSQSPAIPVGSTGQVPVVVRQAPVPFTYIHFGYSYDAGGLDVTGLTAPAGWSGNGCPYSSPGQGCYTSSGTPALTLGSTAFTADVTCLAPGTWDLTVASSSALGTVHYLNSLIHGLGGVNGPDMAVSAVVSVTCVAPPPGPAQATGASVNPADGTLSVTVMGSNLGGAATATLLDGSGNVVATTADFPVKQDTVLTAQFPVTPAGLDTVVVKDAAGDTLAASGGIAVPPALPLFSVRRADSLPQVPGIPLTHFWRLRNAGPVDGIALLLFMLPAYMGPPVLDLPVLPEDTVVLGTGSTSQVRWMEFAVSVGAYGTVDVPVTTDLPPGAVFGTGAPAAPGTFVPLSMTVQAMVPASGWGTVLANAQPGPVTAARAGAAEASGVEEALGALARGTTAARGAYAGALETAFPTLAAALFSKGTFTTLIHAFGLRGGGAS